MIPLLIECNRPRLLAVFSIPLIGPFALGAMVTGPAMAAAIAFDRLALWPALQIGWGMVLIALRVQIFWRSVLPPMWLSPVLLGVCALALQVLGAVLAMVGLWIGG